MSILRNIAIGALGEGINKMEQKDRIYAEIAVDAGKNYFQNVLPKSIEAENLRKSNYDKIFNLTGDRNFAEIMDRDGFTTQANAVDFATNLYKTVDKEKLKAATFETNFEDRYNQRIKRRDEMYQPMLKQLGFGIGTMGPNIMKSLVEEDFVKGKDTATTKQPMEGMTQDEPPAMQASAAGISEFLTQQPEDTQVETKFKQINKSIFDTNAAYGSVERGVEGFIFNQAADYQDMINAHLEIANKLKPGRDQNEIALESTRAMQVDVMPAIEAVQFGDTGSFIKQTGNRKYINLNEAINQNRGDRGMEYDLNRINLSNNQLTFIANTIKSVKEQDVNRYGGKFKSVYDQFKTLNNFEDLNNFYASDTETYKNAYAFAAIIKADQLDKNYGYQTSQLFLASLPQVKSLQGGDLVNGITFAVNKLRADRLNNRG
jgi:hypothetical protein